MKKVLGLLAAVGAICLLGAGNLLTAFVGIVLVAPFYLKYGRE